MRFKLFGGIVAVVMLLAVNPAIAHHSFGAEYDDTKPIKFQGKITLAVWANPHGWIYVDVQEPDGEVVNWACETNPFNVLYRRGWRKEHLLYGTVVTIEGYRAKGSQKIMNTYSVKLPDGRVLSAMPGARPNLENAVDVGKIPDEGRISDVAREQQQAKP